MTKRKSPSSSGVITVVVEDHIYDVYHHPWTTTEVSTNRVYETVEITLQTPALTAAAEATSAAEATAAATATVPALTTFTVTAHVAFVVHRSPVCIQYYHIDHVVPVEGRQIRIPDESPVHATLKDLIREECIRIPEDIADEMDVVWEAASI